MAKKGTDYIKKYGRPGDGYFPVFPSVVESKAHRSLCPVAKCLLSEFLVLHHRTKANGKLNLSVDTAAKHLGKNRKTVMSAYHELVEHGFLECTVGDVYQERLARLWRITFLPWDGREPTDEWLNGKGEPIPSTAPAA